MVSNGYLLYKIYQSLVTMYDCCVEHYLKYIKQFRQCGFVTKSPKCTPTSITGVPCEFITPQL